MAHKRKSEKVILFIRVPQDVEKPVPMFEQFLVNIHEVLHHIPISFEITSYNQHIYFFAVIDRHYRELLEGQLYSIYPFAEIEEVSDYANSSVLEQGGFAGRELWLKRSDIIPIKTYKEFESDSLAGVLSVLTKAEAREKIWIQVFIQPLLDDWKLNLIRKLKLKLNSIKLYFRIKNYFKLKTARGMRSLELEACKHKADEHAYRTLVRIAYVAETKEKAEAKLDALTKAFFQFNTIDLNGFRAVKIRPAVFFQRYKGRLMTGGFTLNAAEAASLYHIPHPEQVPHVVHVISKKAEPPRDLPREGTVKKEEVSIFGITNFHNQNFVFGVKREDRRRHLYVVGKSGTGKSKLLELLINADIQTGHGIGILDPHGDLVDAVIRYIPKHRIEDVVFFNPADVEYPVAFNPLEQVPPEYRVRVTIGFVEIFKKVFGANWTPRLEHVLRYTTLALLDSPNTTILSILKMLSDKNYRQKIVARIEDSVVKNFWVNEFAAWSEKFDNEAIMPVLNKVGQFVSTMLIRNIVGQPVNKIDMRKIMDEGKILLVRLSKGFLGEENTQLLGAMFVTKIHQAAMSRTDIPEEKRRDFYLYADEFQYFATDTFGEILSEARKYHLNLTMAHQYMGQLSDFVRKTAFGNVGTIISFRVGAEDAVVLENEYSPIFKVRDIINLGVREFFVKMSIDGEMRDAFSARTINAPQPSETYIDEIVEFTRKHYARPKKEVEEELRKWDEAALTEEEASLVSALEEKFAEPMI